MHSVLQRLLGFKLPLHLGSKVQGRHTLILGKTGSGKSELLKALFYTLQQGSMSTKNKTLVLLDPHGNLCEQVLKFQMNRKHPSRVVYLNPLLHSQKTPCLNPFWKPVPHLHQAELMAQQRTYAFLQMMNNSTLSLQMKTLLEPCLTALFLNEKQELSTLQRWMKAPQGDPYFEHLAGRLPPNSKQFLQEGFFDKRYEISKTSLYTKLQSIHNHQVLYHLFNGKPTLDLETVVNQGNIILVNLNKGLLGGEVSNILGKFFMADLFSVVFRRTWKGIPTYLFVDEFQSMASQSLMHLLSESRKKNLFFIGATQSLHYFSEPLKNQLSTNTSLQMIGATHPQDVRSLTRYRNLPKEAFADLKKHQFFVKYESYAPVKINAPAWFAKTPYLLEMKPKEKQELKAEILQSALYREKTQQTHLVDDTTVLQPYFKT